MKPKTLSLENLLEVKILRFANPKMNTSNIPLSGIYNSFTNLETDQGILLENKMKNFDISSSKCVSVDNMFCLSSSFGKVLLNDTLEALILVFNKSDKIIKFKFINLFIEVTLKNHNKKQRIPIFTNATNEIMIEPRKFFSHKFSLPINSDSKFYIYVETGYTSPIFNDIYRRESQISTGIIQSEVNEQYRIEGSEVIRLFNKSMYFEVLNPFKIKEKCHNLEMKQCLVEITIDNTATMPVRILDISLYPKNNTNLPIDMYNQEKFSNILIEYEEQLNVVFKISNPAIYNKNDSYILVIRWLHLFDSVPKAFQCEIKNTLNIYNDSFAMSVIEKPQGDIIQNQNFKVIFQLDNKRSSLLNLTVSTEKVSDRDIDVIDIVEKEFAIQSNAIGTFCLICKCDILGTVKLPKLHINDESKIIYDYDNLLSFNCVKEISLI